MRVASVPRSVEIKPLFFRFVLAGCLLFYFFSRADQARGATVDTIDFFFNSPQRREGLPPHKKVRLQLSAGGQRTVYFASREINLCTVKRVGREGREGLQCTKA